MAHRPRAARRADDLRQRGAFYVPQELHNILVGRVFRIGVLTSLISAAFIVLLLVLFVLIAHPFPLTGFAAAHARVNARARSARACQSIALPSHVTAGPWGAPQSAQAGGRAGSRSHPSIAALHRVPRRRAARVRAAANAGRAAS